MAINQRIELVHQLFEKGGAYHRADEYNRPLREELTCLLLALIGDRPIGAYVDWGTITEEGGSLTSLLEVGRSIMRVDTAYAINPFGVSLRETSIAQAPSSGLLAVTADVTSGDGGLDPAFVGSQGFVMRMLLPEGLRRIGEDGWWQADLSRVFPSTRRLSIYRAWADVLSRSADLAP